MEVLREEIRETEKTRNDLLKWKLGLVGTLGGAGLGLAGSQKVHPPDLVLLRFLRSASTSTSFAETWPSRKCSVIGTFFRKLEPASPEAGEAKILSEYEKHVEEARQLDLNARGLKWFPSSESIAFAVEDEALGLTTLRSGRTRIGTRSTQARSPGILGGVRSECGRWRARDVPRDLDSVPETFRDRPPGRSRLLRRQRTPARKAPASRGPSKLGDRQEPHPDVFRPFARRRTSPKQARSRGVVAAGGG